eukprot:8775242-Alexandrium_andersonii.AAC.1
MASLWLRSGTAEAARVPPACHQAPWRTRQPHVLVCPPYAYQCRHSSSGGVCNCQVHTNRTAHADPAPHGA